MTDSDNTEGTETIIEFHIAGRSKCIKTLTAELKLDKKKIKEMEDGIYHFTREYCFANKQYLVMASGIYQNKVQDILFNLDAKNNDHAEELIKRIKKFKNAAYNLAYLKPDELNESNWASIKQKKERTENKRKDLPKVKGKPCKFCSCTEYYHEQ